MVRSRPRPVADADWPHHLLCRSGQPGQAAGRQPNFGMDGNDGAGRGNEGDLADPDDPYDLGAFSSPTYSPAPSPDVKAMTHTVPGIDNEDDAGGLTDLNGDGKIDHLDWIASGNAKDVNGDGKIDVMDWALASDGITDLNGDGRIDHLDWILAGDGKDLNGDGKVNAQDWVVAGRPGYGLGKYATGSGVFSVGTSSGGGTFADGSTTEGFTSDGNAYKTYDEGGYMVDIGWGAAGVQAGGTFAPTPSPAFLEFITVGEDGKLSWDYAAAAAAGYGHLTEAQIAEILGAADSQRTTEIGTKVTTTTTTTTTPGLEVATGSANLSFGSATGGTEETKKANLQVSMHVDSFFIHTHFVDHIPHTFLAFSVLLLPIVAVELSRWRTNSRSGFPRSCRAVCRRDRQGQRPMEVSRPAKSKPVGPREHPARS